MIAAAALDLIDEDGADKFSINRLAKRLGVTSPSIYYYFDTRDELLTEVGVLVLKKVKGPPPTAHVAWQDWLERSAMRYYDALRLHPRAMSLLIDRRTHPMPPELFESALGRMSATGIAPERGLVLVEAMSALALSWVGRGPAERLAKVFDGCSAESFPVLCRARSVRISDRSRFRMAVRGLIAGFTALDG